MKYFELHSIYKLFFQSLLLFLLVFQISKFMSFVSVLKKTKAIVIQAIGIVINMVVLIVLVSEYQYMIHEIKHSELIYGISQAPVWTFMLLVLLLFGSTLLSTKYLKEVRKKNLSINAIKEGTDDIPMGICYAKVDGMAILVNRKMYMLSLMICGVALQNPTQFWTQITEGELPEGIKRVKDGNEPVILLSDGTVWTFSKEYVNMGKGKIIQILAIDSTSLYRLSLELAEKNKSLKQMNMRLQNYSENVTDLTRDEEILATKVKIHADMGSALLATRYYFHSQKGKKQAEALIKSWEYNVSMLYNEASTEQKDDVFRQLVAAAEAVGVTIEVFGNIPKQNVKAERLIVAAARECLTNTVRHGDGDKVTIRIREEYLSYHVVYTNNGSTPEESIKEGGGLLGLRRRVEDMGGNMKIISNPTFMVIIDIPKERR